MNESNVILRAYFFVVLSMFLSSLGPSVFMLLLKDTDMNREFGIMLFLLFGGLAYAIVYLFGSESGEKKQQICWNTKVLIKLLFSGVLAAVQYFTFTISMQLGSVTETTMFVRLSPLFNVILSSFFLDEKIISKNKLFLATVLCLGGAFLMQGICLDSLKRINILFILFGVMCALTMATNNVFNGSMSKYDKLPHSLIVAVEMIIGALLMIPFIRIESLNLPSLEQFGILVFLGVFTIAVPNFIKLFAYHATGSMGKIAFFSYLLPVFGSVAAYFINKERGFDYMTLGFSFIIISAGIYFANESIDKKNQ